MQRRNFIQAFLASVGIGTMTKPAKALPPPKKLILFVRPQDYHMWMIRTAPLVYTTDGVVRQEGTLRYDAAQRKLWYQKGDMALPRIAGIRVCPKLVWSEESTWRVEYVD